MRRPDCDLEDYLKVSSMRTSQMRSKRAMLTAFAYVCLAIVLPSPASSEPPAALRNVQRIKSSVSKFGFNHDRPLVHGCGPAVVGEDCEKLVSKTISRSAHKQQYPCPTRHGDFPVPNDLQKFYRCHGDIFTIQDCGKLYVFDPDLRYCVPMKKGKSIPKPSKKSKTHKKPSSPKTKPPTATTTPAPPVCPRGLSSPLLGNSTADQDMVQACTEKKLCGASLNLLGQLRETQCKMYRSGPIKVKTRKAKNIVQWNVSISDSYIREARFWWVADIPLQLVWRSPGFVTTLQDCLAECKDRFVIAGPTICACGSISEEYPAFSIENWINKQNSKTLNKKEGFLLYDKEAFKTGGWTCTTEPVGWKKYSAKRFAQCISVCKKAKKDFVSFGKGGCRCGNAADAGAGFRNLPMVHCQKRIAGVDAYSVLDVTYWTDTYRRIGRRQKSSVFWADKRPQNVIWRTEVSRPDASSCLNACIESGKARWISIGVTGCECGVSDTNGYKANLDWRLTYTKKFFGQHWPARGFFLVKIKRDLQGFRPKFFDFNQTFTVPHGNDTLIYTHRAPQPASDVIASKMSNMVEKRHRKIDFFRIRAGVVPSNASTRLTQRSSEASGSSESLSTVNTTGQLVRDLKTAVGKHYRKVWGAVGYFGYERQPYYQKENVKELAVLRLSRFSAHSSTFSSLRASAVALQKRFGYRKRETQSAGQIFFIKPTIFGDCFTGVANTTGWKNLGKKPDTLRKCICACEDQNKIPKTNSSGNYVAVIYRAVILQGAQCYCSTTSKQLGSLIASVPKPARCPSGTAREAYIKNQHSSRSNRAPICKDFKGHPGLQVIGPGMTGVYRERVLARFEHISTCGKAVSEDYLMATGNNRVVRTAANFTVLLHNKKGLEAHVHGVKFEKSLFPRTFRLRFLVTEKYFWREHHAVYSGYEGQYEKYERGSHSKKKDVKKTSGKKDVKKTSGKKDVKKTSGEKDVKETGGKKAKAD